MTLTTLKMADNELIEKLTGNYKLNWDDIKIFVLIREDFRFH